MTNKLSLTLRRFNTALKYLVTGDFKGFYTRIKTYLGYPPPVKKYPIRHARSWVILATPQTLYVAHLITERLNYHGYRVKILNNTPLFFSSDYYIVLCPQMFSRLPPKRKRIIYQLEQSTAPRWFTTGYLQNLNTSLAVIDYSIKNIQFFDSKEIKYPRVYYVPIGASKTYGAAIPKQNATCEVLFYGDNNSSARQQNMLKALQEHFTVSIVNEIFENEIQQIIKSAKVVINLHYYENALLEMLQIQECLSLGIPVVSESTQDQVDYPELSEAVIFFETGSIPSMIAAVQKALDAPPSAASMQKAIDTCSNRFEHMFDRFLVGMKFLPASYVTKINISIPDDAELITLSLPESVLRRKTFETFRPKNCYVFDGIRCNPAWIGCGLSYVYLAHAALKKNYSCLTVMEDDIFLKENFEETLHIIREYLAVHHDQWDIFSGLIADLDPECVVTHVETYKGIQFVTINRMVSMVFNIYNESILRLLLLWDPENFDIRTNTIDRFIEKHSNLRVIVTLPFTVGHREEARSTLWDFENTQYVDMIAKSQQILYKKVADFNRTR